MRGYIQNGWRKLSLGHHAGANQSGSQLETEREMIDVQEQSLYNPVCRAPAGSGFHQPCCDGSGDFEVNSEIAGSLRKSSSVWRVRRR